jgi:hypothetical protein
MNNETEDLSVTNDPSSGSVCGDVVHESLRTEVIKKMRETAGQLEAAINDRDMSHKMLTKQARFLDTMLQTLIDQGIEDEQSTEKWLMLALQIQKQCVFTLKTHASIDYLNATFPYNRRWSPPSG